MERLKELGWYEKDLGSELGLSQSQVSKLINNKDKNLSIQQILALAKALSLHPDEVITHEHGVHIYVDNKNCNINCEINNAVSPEILNEFANSMKNLIREFMKKSTD